MPTAVPTPASPQPYFQLEAGAGRSDALNTAINRDVRLGAAGRRLRACGDTMIQTSFEQSGAARHARLDRSAGVQALSAVYQGNSVRAALVGEALPQDALYGAARLLCPEVVRVSPDTVRVD